MLFKKYLYVGLLLPSIIGSLNCKKMVSIDPPFTSVSTGNIYNNNSNAAAVLTSVYTQMMNNTLFNGSGGISMNAGLSADELSLYSGVSDLKLNAYYKNALTGDPNTNYGSDLWTPIYNYIFTCNSAIEGINGSSGLTVDIQRQVMGEAKFMRAFFYFYLVNLFGDVPLATTTNSQVNTLLPRMPKADLYKQIISDLREAESLLSDKYLQNDAFTPYTSGSEERVRPTKWAAAALLARVYLYNGDYSNAEAEATLVLNKTDLYSLMPLNSVFLKNSKEAIWQLQPVKSGINTDEAQTFVLTNTGPTTTTARPVYASPQLRASFEVGDLRNLDGNWITKVITTAGTTYYYFSKYKNTSSSSLEYLMVLRLAEQYLIRAEARVQQNNISGAQSDLNVIRARVNLPATIAVDKVSLLTAIMHERQTELFCEWGHRWLDIRRTNNIDNVMRNVTPLKANGAPWQSYQQFYPILWADILKDPNLIQNPGY